MPDAATLFASLLFGIVGFAAFRYGKKSASLKAMLLGAALMVYPYFVEDIWLLYVIGVALTAGLFVWRD